MIYGKDDDKLRAGVQPDLSQMLGRLDFLLSNAVGVELSQSACEDLSELLFSAVKLARDFRVQTATYTVTWPTGPAFDVSSMLNEEGQLREQASMMAYAVFPLFRKIVRSGSAGVSLQFSVQLHS